MVDGTTHSVSGVEKMPRPTTVYDQICDAINKLNMGEEVRARNELIRLHVISWNDGVAIASAISTFRTLAQQLDSN